MLISYNWLQEYLEKPLPNPEELARVLTMHAFEVEEVNEIDGDYVLDIDVLPNRTHDCLSYLGMAREVSVLTDNSLKKTEDKIDIDDSLSSRDFISLEVEDPSLVRRAMKRMVVGVDVGESPEWLKSKLLKHGQKSINNIVDITNFVMFETGQPVHAFDFDKISVKSMENPKSLSRRQAGEIRNPKEIIIRNAKEGEKIKTLDGGEYELDPSTLVIADDDPETGQGKPLDIAGVKGGASSGIDENTTKIVLSVCNFHPTRIRKTSRGLGLLTDASKRFEQEITPELAEKAMQRLSSLISEVAGGKVSEDVLDEYPRKRNPYKIGVNTEEVNGLLGTNLSSKNVEEILERLGFEFEKRVPIEFVLNEAQEHEGKPYKFGASVSYDCPDVFDCGALINYLFAHAGIALPRMVQDQFAYLDEIDANSLSAGDIVYSSTGGDGDSVHVEAFQEDYVRKTAETVEFMPGKKFEKSVDHGGIYLGDGKIIHASPMWDKGKVVIEDLAEAPAFKEIVGYRRVSGADTERFVVVPPSERLDLMAARSFLASGTSADIIEEIGRVYGYENINEEVPKGDWSSEVNKEFYYANKIRDILTSEGFSEIQTYAFVDEGEVEVANPIASDKNFLRSSLVPGLKTSIVLNEKNKDLLGIQEIKIFEIGTVFKKAGEHVSLAIYSENGSDNIIKKINEIEELDFEESDNILEADMSPLFEKDAPDSCDDLEDIDTKDVRYKSISPYPFVLRDIAVWVPEGVSSSEVSKLISSNAGEWLVRGDLFDEYKKDDKISYAFHLVFQSQDKTLSDEEVNKVMKAVEESIADRSWEVR